jgi:hypothetical protein
VTRRWGCRTSETGRRGGEVKAGGILLEENPLGVFSQCTRDQFQHLSFSSVASRWDQLLRYILRTSSLCILLLLLVLVGEVILSLSRPSRNNLRNSPLPTFLRLQSFPYTHTTYQQSHKREEKRCIRMS